MPQEPMPECPYCNVGDLYVIPSEGGFHCNHCDGNFGSNGEWMAAYEEEDDEMAEPCDHNWRETFDGECEQCTLCGLIDC